MDTCIVYNRCIYGPGCTSSWHSLPGEHISWRSWVLSRFQETLQKYHHSLWSLKQTQWTGERHEYIPNDKCIKYIKYNKCNWVWRIFLAKIFNLSSWRSLSNVVCTLVFACIASRAKSALDKINDVCLAMVGCITKVVENIMLAPQPTYQQCII